MDLAESVQKLRSLVHQSLDHGGAFNSCFFADKLVTLTAGRPSDVLLLAKAHFSMGDHRQALDALRKYGLLESDPPADMSASDASSASAAGEFASSPASPGFQGPSEGDGLAGTPGLSRAERHASSALRSPGPRSASSAPSSGLDFLRQRKDASPFSTSGALQGSTSNPEFSFDGDYSFSDSQEPDAATSSGVTSGGGGSASGGRGAGSGSGGQWACVVCTFLNGAADAACAMCSTPGPSEEERMAMASPPPRAAAPFDPTHMPPQPANTSGGDGVFFQHETRDRKSAGPMAGGAESTASSWVGVAGVAVARDSLALQALWLGGQCLAVLGDDDECAELLLRAVGGEHGAEAAAHVALRTAKAVNAQKRFQGVKAPVSPPAGSEGQSTGLSPAAGQRRAPVLVGVDLRACCCALLGKVLAKADKYDRAVHWLATALRIDPYCSEAFEVGREGGRARQDFPKDQCVLTRSRFAGALDPGVAPAAVERRGGGAARVPPLARRRRRLAEGPLRRPPHHAPLAPFQRPSG